MVFSRHPDLCPMGLWLHPTVDHLSPELFSVGLRRYLRPWLACGTTSSPSAVVACDLLDPASRADILDVV